MTAPVHEQTATLPAQAEPAAPVVPPLIDHVSAHSHRCYWDFRECRWVCRTP